MAVLSPPNLPAEAPSAATEALPAATDVREFEPFRVSVERYHEMIAAGAIGEDDRVELLEGVLVTTMPQGPRHAFVQEELLEACRAAAGPSLVVRSEKPVTLDDSEPEPDVAVVAGPRDRYRSAHPAGGDCRLVIEVADSSLRRDVYKARLFAAAGVAEYWVVDLEAARVIVHLGPRPGGYAEVHESPSARTDLPGGPLAFDAAALPEA